VRLEAGAVVEEFELPGVGHVVARHTRTRTSGGDTWACLFSIVAEGVSDLSVVHRLSAPSLPEARRSVRHAAEFLAGRALAGEPAGQTVIDRPGTVVVGPDGRTPERVPDRRSSDRRATDDLGVPRIPVFGLPADGSFDRPRESADPRFEPMPPDPAPAPLG
jgi:hypothetical protein